MKRRSTSITGIVVFILLLVAAYPLGANAIYSPTIYKHVEEARRHLRGAQAISGTGTTGNAAVAVGGTVADAWEEWQAKQKEQAKADPKYARVEPPNLEDAKKTVKWYGLYGSSVVDNLVNDSLGSFYTYLGWLVGHPYSACVRNDISEIEDLMNTLSNEMIRMAILLDDTNYTVLKRDYLTLQDDIKRLQDHPDDPGRYLFPGGSTNYYLDGQCPENEWSKAIEDLMKSLTHVKESVLRMGSSDDWFSVDGKSIGDIAEKRAKKRSEEWIRNNQIKLGIGGETGAPTTSVLKLSKKGWEGFSRDLELYSQEVKDLVGPHTPWGTFPENWGKVTCAIFSLSLKQWKQCTEAEKAQFDRCKERGGQWYLKQGCGYFAAPDEELTATELVNRYNLQKEAKTSELEKAERAVRYQLHFDALLQTAEIKLDETLGGLDGEIRKMYDQAHLAEILSQFSLFEKRYCANRTASGK